MKKLLLFPILLFGFQAFADEGKRLSSKLDAVTLYAQGAGYSREISTNLQAGDQTLIFEGLPLNLEPSSVQIGSDKSLEFISISTGNTPFDQREKPAKFQQLERQIKEINLQSEDIQAELEALQLELEFLTNNTKLGGNEGFSLAELQQISSYARDQKLLNKRSQLKKQRVLQDLNDKRKELQSELQKIRQEMSLLSGEIIVKLNSNRAQNVRFSIHYTVRTNASWSSNYNLYFDGLDKDLRMVHKANVYQGSGEDWENVALKLVTGSPNQNVTMPQIYPQYIQFMHHASPTKLRGARADDDEVYFIDGVKIEGNVNNSQMGNTVFAINSQQTRLEFIPERRYSIPNQKTENIVIREMALKAEYEYQSSPSLDPAAYLMAIVKDWEQHQLLDGELSIYNQGLFIGKSFSQFEATSDSLQLSLGKDPGIVITRDRLFNEESKSFLGSDRIQKYEYQISLRNTKPQNVKIRVFDQIPVSQNEDIKVKSEIENQGKLNLKTGIITWEMDLKPKSESQLKFSFEVRAPKDQTISW
ncbi:mucoidy inhibitor MuiA family protein [Croceimicrobium hydrocarbonivorans]|uniref:Mucoidy inhibitor MuiA family protein n=1 Tax=Croceimicrobium hydrocarbonivorans TaxID=2761580 RepID=A0A7H0VJE3_9FLAO|nr:mucoidy inhibitor MuiA family protein [Croceimicrobium hydrocarbonivorans]QNR25841.1 mucoidy inhibitor MuiA family protein [Croceimicrobium hydrocarbonivorans]